MADATDPLDDLRLRFRYTADRREGEAHRALWVRGRGWVCNIYPDWRRDCPHRKRYPFLPPMLAVAVAVKR